MIMNRLSVAFLAVLFGIGMGGNSMTKEMYELQWSAIQKLASPLYDEEGNVDISKLATFADDALTYIKEYQPHPHDGPIYNLYDQLGINNTELGQCLNDFKSAKHATMKWMGVAMFSGLKCKINQFKGSLFQTECAKESMKECLPVMLHKAIKAKKMIHKVKKAAKMVSLTCSETNNGNDPLSLFLASGAAPPMEHHIKGPMCMIAAFSNMIDDESEKEVCQCMRDEFEAAGMPISKEMFQTKLQWFNAVVTALQNAPALPPGSNGETPLPPLPPLPEELKVYDPFYAAQCVAQHCTMEQLTNILSMTGLMDIMTEMTKIKEYFGEEMIEMAQKKCQCMKEFIEADADKSLPKIFQDYPEICTDNELMKNVLGMGSDRLEQDKQCAQHIVDMLERGIANMPDDA